MFDSWEIAGFLAGLVVVAGGALYYWRRLQSASVAERQTMLEEAVERLVQEAESLMPESGRGYERLRWVLSKVRKTWPDAGTEEIMPAIEINVAKVNRAALARRAHRQRNGNGSK